MTLAGLLLSAGRAKGRGVNTTSFERVKQREGQQRASVLRAARRSPKAAAKLQRRVSLVGDAAWRITNFKQVAHAMSKWTEA